MLTIKPPSISDHEPVSCILPFALPGSPVFTAKLVCSWKKLDPDKFRSAIHSIQLHDSIEGHSQKIVSITLHSNPRCHNNDFYAGMDADALFQVYEETLHDLLDLMGLKHEQ